MSDSTAITSIFPRRVRRKEYWLVDPETHEITGYGDINEWAQAQTTPGVKLKGRMHVGDSSVLRLCRVSTVFMGIDHGGYPFVELDGVTERPIVFETMIFGGPLDQKYQTRCSTWAEAEEMHAMAIRAARVSIALWPFMGLIRAAYAAPYLIRRAWRAVTRRA